MISYLIHNDKWWGDRMSVSVIGSNYREYYGSYVILDIPNTSLVVHWERSDNKTYPSGTLPRTPSGIVNLRFSKSRPVHV